MTPSNTDTPAGPLADEQEIQAAIKLAEIVLPRGVLRDIAVSRMKYHAGDRVSIDTALELSRSIHDVAALIAGQESPELVRERFDSAVRALHASPNYREAISSGVPDIELTRRDHIEMIVHTVLSATGTAVPDQYYVLRCEECGPEAPIPFRGPDAELDSRQWMEEHTKANDHTVSSAIEYR